MQTIKETTNQPLLNELLARGQPYLPECPRTAEDDKALIWNAKLFQSTKRTHCAEERFEKIFSETMSYIMTTEHHMYADIQRGITREEEFVLWLKTFFRRNYPEMSNENDFNIMYGRLRTAIFRYYVLQPLIDHDDTSDIKICGPKDIRVRVKGKAYRSSSCFINELDLFRFVEGLAIRNGLDFTYPEITFTDAHDENYILRFLVSTPIVNAVDYPYLHVRKVPKEKPTFEQLINDAMLIPIVREYIRDRVKTSKGIVISGPPGCVDRETEFFNGKEWKSIADYQEGEQVLQFDTETNEASLVLPLRYIKEPCSTMYHFETARGTNQTLSPEHRVLYYTRTNNGSYSRPKEMSAEEMYRLQCEGKFHGYFKTDFVYEGQGLNLSDAEIKLMLAVICDGTFPSHHSEHTKYCSIRLKKKRKKRALEAIFSECGIEPHILSEKDGYTRYSFQAPRKEKIFTADWYECTSHQFQIICDNILQWDGSYGKRGGRTFSTSVKENADFVQFAFSTCGERATISVRDRRGQTHKAGSQKKYEYKSLEYTICISRHNMVSMQWDKRSANHPIPVEVTPSDGYKYCFTVPTHALVLRRNGRIFLTRNSGKTTLANAMLEDIPKTRETLVIQENDELHTKQSGFMFKHVTHGFKGEPLVTLEELGKMALVEGCNEFVIGEVKGGEMRYAATLMNSGGYCMYTTHAENARGVLPRCADLIKYGSDYSFEDACKQIQCVKTIIYMEQYQVQEILENLGYDPSIKDFRYRVIYKNPHPRWETETRPSEIPELGLVATPFNRM